MHRVGSSHHNYREFYPPGSDIPVIELAETWMEGATAIVYKSTCKQIVLKVFNAEAIDGSMYGDGDEAESYTVLSKVPTVTIPKLLGIFELGLQTVYAMMYEGEPPLSLDALSYPSRQVSYSIRVHSIRLEY